MRTHIKTLGTALCAVAFAATATLATTASAASPGAGKSYGCQINPKATDCIKAAQPIVNQNGSVAGVQTGSASQPTSLPSSGGAASSSMPNGSGTFLPILVGFMFIVLGFGARRFSVATRRQ